MDLYALLAKKSVETGNAVGATTSRAKAAQGFADALSAARGRLSSGDPVAALGGLLNQETSSDAAAESEVAKAEDSAASKRRKDSRASAVREGEETRPRAHRTEESGDETATPAGSDARRSRVHPDAAAPTEASAKPTEAPKAQDGATAAPVADAATDALSPEEGRRAGRRRRGRLAG